MKLRLPQALLAAILVAAAQTNAITVTDGTAQQGTFAANAGTSVNGITYTVDATKKLGTINDVTLFGTATSQEILFELDQAALRQAYASSSASSTVGTKLVIMLVSNNSATRGLDVTDLAFSTISEQTAGSPAIVGDWKGTTTTPRVWFDNSNSNKRFTAWNEEGAADSAWYVLTSNYDTGENGGTNLWTSTEKTQKVMDLKGLRASNTGFTSVVFSSEFVKNVAYTYNAQVLTSADSAWTETYNTFWKITAANTALPTDNTLAGKLDGVLVTAGSLNVAAGDGLTNLNKNVRDIVVGGSGQLVVTGNADETLTLKPQLVLGASTHASAGTQGAIYFNNTAGAINVSGDIKLIEDSTIGATSGANAVTISGEVAGAHTLKVLGSQNKSIAFTGGVDISSLDFGDYDVLVTVSGKDATFGRLESTGTGNTTLKVDGVAVTVNGDVNRVGVLDVVDENSSVHITGNYESNKTAVSFTTKGAGSVTIDGDFSMTAQTVALSIGADTTVGGSFTSTSQVNVLGGASLSLTKNDLQTFTNGLNVAAGAGLSTAGNLSIGSGSDLTHGSLTNAGTVTAGGMLQVYVTDIANGKVTNTGVLSATGIATWGHIINGVEDGDNSGTSLTLERDYATSTAHPDATLTNYATMSARVIENHAVITNAGTMTATGGLTNTGTFTNSGTLNISGGNVGITKSIQNTGSIIITLTDGQSVQAPASLANLEQQSLTGLFHDTTGQEATSGYEDAYYYLVHSTDGGTLSYTAATTPAGVSTDGNGNLLYRHDSTTYMVNDNMTYGASGANNDVYDVTAGHNIQVNDGATLTLTEGVKANIGLSTSGTGAVSLNGSISSLGTSVAGISNLKVAAGNTASMTSSLAQSTNGISLESTGSLTVTMNGNINTLNLNLSKVSGSGGLTVTANDDSRELNIGSADNFTGTLTINDNSRWIAITGTSAERENGDYYDLVTVKNSGSTKGLAFGTVNMVWHVGNLSGSADISGQYNSGGTRTLVVHQTRDEEYSGKFLADGPSVGRSVSLQKYGDKNLTLTADNKALASLDIYEGTVTFKDSGTWAGAVNVKAGATLAYNGDGKEMASTVSFDFGSTLAVTGGDLAINADKSLSAVSIAKGAALTIGAGATTSVDYSISNSGTLNINGTLSVNNVALLTSIGENNYSEVDNGYLLGGEAHLFDSAGTVTFGTNGRIVIGSQVFTALQDNGNITVTVPAGETGTYYVNTGTVVYGATGEGASEVSAAGTKKIGDF